MVRNRWIAVAFAATAIALAAGCAGGSSTSSLVPGQPSADTPSQSTRLAPTSAPANQISELEQRKGVTRGTPEDPLANWVFLAPLAISDVSGTGVFNLPSFVTRCSSIDPIFGGLWYLALSNFSVTVPQVQLPGCAIPSTTSSVAHRDGVLPAGNNNIYIVEIDLGIFSLSTTPLEGPAVLGANNSFVFGEQTDSLSFQSWNLYAFFIAEYTGTGTPSTQSI